MVWSYRRGLRAAIALDLPTQGKILYKLFYDSFMVKRSKNAIISQQCLPTIVRYNLPQNYNAYTIMSNSLANLKKKKFFLNKDKPTIF